MDDSLNCVTASPKTPCLRQKPAIRTKPEENLDPVVSVSANTSRTTTSSETFTASVKDGNNSQAALAFHSWEWNGSSSQPGKNIPLSSLSKFGSSNSKSFRKVIGIILTGGFLLGISLGSSSSHPNFPKYQNTKISIPSFSNLNLQREFEHSTNYHSYEAPIPYYASSNARRILHDDTNNNNSTKCAPEEDGGWVNAIPQALQFTLITVLILFSAFFSGLTLSLMGLDTIGLEIVMSGDDPVLSRAARKIYPVRKNGNLLLCTLLLGNVAVNTLLGILMADITGGTVGFISSTVLIVIFGEIIPQALFSRYALQVGERAVPVVKVIIFICYVMAKPLAFCLDKLLGHELGTTYSKAEMSKLLEIHVKEGRFNQETGTAMAGALKYQDMAVKDVMTPLENTFMINVDEKLNFDTMSTIFKTGYSRIPVYETSVSNVIGLLFVKDLIFIDPDDETPVRNFVDIFGRGAHVVWPDDKLGEVLKYLKKGHTHMALVRDVNNNDETQDPYYELKGIITLEDIIEIILGEEIVDETDAWVDGEHSIKVNRAADFDWARLRLLDTKIVDQHLSEDEVRAVSAHLRKNYSALVNSLSDKQLVRMIDATNVTELPVAEKEVGELLPANLLYKKNTPSDVCTLILNGKITVVAGQDNFRSDVSSWSVLGTGALADPLYTPDFSAFVSGDGPCRCLQFSRDIFTAASDTSALEKVSLKGEPESLSIATSGEEDVKQPKDVRISGSFEIENGSIHSGGKIETSTPSGLAGRVASESRIGTGPNVREHRGKLLETFFQKKESTVGREE